MSTTPVHWHEGMFLRPHHFQAAERYWAEQLRLSASFDVHYNWGARLIRIDTDALQDHRFVVERLEARLRDGTLVVAEQGTDHALAPLDLRPAVERLGPGETLDVLLAVPTLQLGSANTGPNDDPTTRYSAAPSGEPIEDENDGRTPRLVGLRRLKARLLAAGEDTSGYETIPLARLERSADTSGTPRLHEWYVPPVLACDGWPPLAKNVVGAVYSRLGGLVRNLARQAREQGIKFDSNAPEHRRVFERLRALNEGHAAFGVVARAAGAHPFWVYLELCRLAGTLAVFGKTAALADELPAYDHDDLGRCFYAVKRQLDELFAADFTQGYEVRPFVGDANRMKVKIDREWLAPACQMLVGVESPVPAADCVKLLAVDMKIAALERVDEVYKDGGRGLKFVHEKGGHPVLPATASRKGHNLVYFRVTHEGGAEDEWEHVNRTYNLAVKLNPRHLVGSLDRRPSLTIQAADGRPVTLWFSLYVVLPSAQQSGE
jgi:type VI secretion system protein ImpJ